MFVCWFAGPTEIVERPLSVELSVGVESVLRCSATTDDSTLLSITWEHDGVPVPVENSFVEEGVSILPVVSANATSEEINTKKGEYTCHASNGYSSDSASAEAPFTETGTTQDFV